MAGGGGGRDRHLLRGHPTAAADLSSSSSGSGAAAVGGPRASSSVVGLVPPSVHVDLRRCRPPATGFVDPTGSGLAVAALSRRDEGGGAEGGGVVVVSVWPHETRTLSEELAAPEGAARFVHPEPSSPWEEGGGAVHGGLVALAPHAYAGAGIGAAAWTPPPPGGSARGGGRGGGGRVRVPSAPAHSLYVCSPSGVLCLWNDALQTGSSGGGEAPPFPPCDASVRIPLDGGERVTVAASAAHGADRRRSPSSGRAAECVGGGGAGGDVGPPVLLGTSAGRVWMCVRTSRPLQLRARPLRPRRSYRGEGGGGRGGASGGTLLGWLLGSEGGGGSFDAEEDYGNDEDEEEDEVGTGGVAAILPLPGAAAAAVAGGTSGLESPRKAARTRRSEPTSFLCLTDGMVLSKWSLRADEDDDASGGAGGGGGALVERRDFCHRLRGPALEACLGADEDGGVRAADLSPLRAAVSADGRCLVVAVRVLLSGADGTEEGRLYLLHCSLGLGLGRRRVDAEEGNGPDLRMDGARWLDRHSSDLAMSGAIECAGLAVRGSVWGGMDEGDGDEEEEERGAEGCVAYSVWHDPSAVASSDSAARSPAVVSSVRFRFRPGDPAPPSRSCDVDLPSDVFPSVVSGSVAPDTATDGIVLVGSTGCVANFSVDFPSPASDAAARLRRRAAVRWDVSGREEDVQALASHVLSAFASYARRARARDRMGGGGRRGGRRPRRGAAGPDSDLASALPPSMRTASIPALGAACVLASAALADGGIDPFDDDGAAAMATMAAGTCDAVARRMDVHASFVNFLVHAGAYRRVDAAGRMGMRDHGEILACALAAAEAAEDELRAAGRRGKKKIGGGGGGGFGGKAKDAADEEWRTTLTNFLAGLLDEGVTNLPVWLSELQLSLEGTSGDSVDQVPDAPGLRSTSVDRMSSLLCAIVTAALRYREDHSYVLYDIPVVTRDEAAVGASPWTSRPEALAALTRQLELIGRRSRPPSSSAAEGADGDAARARTLSVALLDGYADLPHHERNEDLYDTAKRLAIPLVRRLCDDGDDAALTLSVQHGHFEGVVGVCHDRAPRKGDRDARRFDLALILESLASPAGGGDAPAPYRALRSTRDHRTDLSFPRYALKWYADRGMFGTVLDLGRRCPPEVLTRHLEEDGRMVRYRWIQDVRAGRFDDAATRLLGLADGAGGGLGLLDADDAAAARPASLDDRRLALSLGRLADALSPADPRRGVRGDGGRRRRKALDDGLLLAQLQEELRGEDGVGPADDAPLTALELVDLAAERSSAGPARGAEGRVRALLAGLAAAETLERGSTNRADAAARIWTAAVLADAGAWSSVLGVPPARRPVSEEEWRDAVSDTTFARLVGEYRRRRADPAASAAAMATTAAGVGVGFRGSADIQERVLSMVGFGGEGLREALRTAAEVAG